MNEGDALEGPGLAHLPELAAQMLGRGRLLHIRAHGTSMYPCIRHGDILEVRPVEVPAIRLGDVIFSRHGNDRLIAHRVIGIGEKWGQVVLATKGDFARHFDRPIHADQVLGQVIAIYRAGRRLCLDGGLSRLTNRLWLWLSLFSPQLRRLASITRLVARGVVNRAPTL